MALSIAPSQTFEGLDGSWSTFALQIGTPPQTIRVLPSTSGSSIWAVIPQGCAEQLNFTDCPSQRGQIFNATLSTSYENLTSDILELPFRSEQPLGYFGSCIAGLDTVVLGYSDSGAPSLSNQTIAGFAITDPFLGYGQLGLSPYPSNITNFTDTHLSPLGSLDSEIRIPSSYWGYTVGAWYRGQDAFGSLTLGGYDAARGNQENVLTVPFATDTNRDLVISINQISITGLGTVAGFPVNAYIDSVVTELWLPLSACASFESAFGLVWNETYGLYLINDTQHINLVFRNASITISLGSTDSSNAATVDITLPYSAFDHQIKYPAIDSSPGDSFFYFPLKRAANASQYYLGRTFLQEAYVAADYQRSQFHISPATWPSPLSATDIKSVYPSSEKLIGSGAIAGIVVGSIVGLGLIVVLAFAIWRYRKRKWQKKDCQSTTNAADAKAQNTRDEEQEEKPELDAKENARQSPWHQHELEGDAEGNDNHKIQEAPGNEIVEVPERRDPVELSAENPVELPTIRH